MTMINEKEMETRINENNLKLYNVFVQKTKSCKMFSANRASKPMDKNSRKQLYDRLWAESRVEAIYRSKQFQNIQKRKRRAKELKEAETRKYACLTQSFPI